MVKFGAIDIGSNAIRLQITSVLDTSAGPFFKKLEYVRFPMRLGREVFNEGRITPRLEERFMKLMEAYKILIDLYDLTDYMGCATSAMREAENGANILQKVEKKLGLHIQLIDGETEASMINDAITEHLDDKTYLHIDVGGGSTELNIYSGGKKTQSASFKIGSVRRLTHQDAPESWKEMEDWIKGNMLLNKSRVTAVGTGGNINKFYELAGKKPGKTMSIGKLITLQQQIRSLSFNERLTELQLNPDRADVIIPASDIYLSVMKWAKAQSILVPSVGLKDGIMKALYKRNKEKIPSV